MIEVTIDEVQLDNEGERWGNVTWTVDPSFLEDPHPANLSRYVVVDHVEVTHGHTAGSQEMDSEAAMRWISEGGFRIFLEKAQEQYDPSAVHDDRMYDLADQQRDMELGEDIEYNGQQHRVLREELDWASNAELHAERSAEHIVDEFLRLN